MLEERLRRLNELGFDAEEVELLRRRTRATACGCVARVVEPGHHRRRLLQLTGLSAQENQARRLLDDIDVFRAWLEARASRPSRDAPPPAAG